MTLKELKQIVDRYYERSERNHDLEICIPNNKGGIRGTSVTKVKGANKGIDWDNNGKFFIFPENPMVE